MNCPCPRCREKRTEGDLYLTFSSVKRDEHTCKKCGWVFVVIKRMVNIQKSKIRLFR